LAVLQHFWPHTRGLTWHRAADGFSGAIVWRGDADAPSVAMKAWPTNITPHRVQQVHAWLAEAGHLPFIPTVFAGSGGTVCLEDGRAWDCCRWQPGSPRVSPTSSEVQAACAAVAQLHEVWAGASEVGPCPGVQNRLRILSENEPLLRRGPDAFPTVAPELDPLLRHAVSLARRLAPQVANALQEWEHRTFALQPCVRDLRAEHVLFDENRVAGIIDFGAMAVDCPAVDLARLLGDCASSNDLFREGVAAYRHIRPAFDVPDEFIRLLAHSGAVGSVLGWLVRILARREPGCDVGLIRSRLARLLVGVEQISLF
jgi:homoserine kinase type II